MRLTLLSKPACTLCDAMRQMVMRVREGYDLDVEEHDVTEDETLAHLELAVPQLMIGEQVLFRFTVSEMALCRVLDERGCPRRHA